MFEELTSKASASASAAPNAALQSPTRPRRSLLSDRQAFGLWALTLILLGGFVQSLLILNGDLQWLLTLDERWLAGARPYVDFLEVNPPMSLLMYMPAVWLSTLTHIPPQYIILVLVLLGIGASTYLTSTILRDVLGPERFRLRFAGVAVFVLIVFPWDVFGQRDHIAVVALFPFVGVAVARQGGFRPANWLLILAGAGAGVAMCIKPHFALVAGMPLLLNAVRTRSIRRLFGLETWIASAVVIAYSAIVAMFFPAYLGGYLQRLVVAYLQVPRRFPLIYASVVVSLVVAALICFRLSNDRRAREWAAPWFAASLGGLMLFLLIGKWWSYSGFAMLAMAVTPVLASMTEEGNARPRTLRWAGRLLAAVTAVCCMNWLAVGPQYAFLSKPVGSVAPPHPKILAITYQLTVGEPLAQRLGGEWVGTSSAEIMSAGAIRREQIGGLKPTTKAMLDDVIASDRHRLLSDIETRQPDLILVDSRLFDYEHFDWWAWANADPNLARALSAYHKVGVVRHRITVWKRNSTSAGGEQIRFDADDVSSKDP